MGNISVKGQATKSETYIGFGVVLLLAGIAFGVFLKQFHYHPAIFVGSVPQGGNALGPTADLSRSILAYTAKGMVPLSPPEIFGPENLSDKINGRAELYLSAGFLSLNSQRFAKASDPNSWMEIFIYDMGTTRRAFAVYSVQRRADAEKIPVIQFAYRTENALFFAHSRYYVEVISTVTTDEMVEAMRSFAHNFVGEMGAQGERIRELSLFPRERLDEESVRLLISDAFGFDRFDNVFMANYVLEDTQLTAFLSMREDPSEASELAAAYHGFLMANGGVDVKSDMEIPRVKLVKILGTYELIFNHGRFLAGVHGAEDRGKAERLAARLMQELSGSEK